MRILILDLAIKAATRPWGRIARRWLGGHWERWLYDDTTVAWYRVKNCAADERHQPCGDHGPIKRRWPC